MELKLITSLIAEKLGITTLTDMQQSVVRSTAHSLILTAPTGSGKTLAFAVRTLRALKSPSGHVQAIIIAPSRELATQIHSVVRPIAQGYKSVAFYGGHSMETEIRALTPMPDIIIATPGRLLDHLQRATFTLTRPLEAFVVDEYDKLLELGFEREMRRLMRHIPAYRTATLTSATALDPLPDYIPLPRPLELIENDSDASVPKPETIEVESFTPDKLDTLMALLRSLPASSRTIVFVNHREAAERVFQRLKSEKLPAILYHGGLEQQQRDTAIDLFTNGTATILVATDLAARGLDIAGVDNIIHYHLPVDSAAWIHRNGRTARMHAEGSVWVITSERDTLPGYIRFDRKAQPPSPTDALAADRSTGIASIFIGAGKKDKISKGDIAGFIAASGAVMLNEIGKIALHDHYAVAAVPASAASRCLQLLNAMKLKGKKVRCSLMRT